MKPAIGTILVKAFLENRIRQMRAVPRQDVINLVQNSHAKVGGVGRRSRRKLK